MPNVHVYHIDVRDASDVIWHGDNLVDKAIHKIKNGSYNLVAVVEADEVSDVFGITNHIDEDWTKVAKRSGRLVRLLNPKPRSSMVGDIFVSPEGGFLVKGIGLERLPKSVYSLLREEETQ